MSQATPMENLQRVIEEQGQIVLSYAWDSDKPGGNGVYDIYQWNGGYYLYDEEFDEMQGPFASLRDALLETGLNQLGGAIGEFRTNAMSDFELAQVLENHTDEDLVLRLNDVWWLFRADGTRTALSEAEVDQYLSPQVRRLHDEVRSWLRL